nr:hypothetical protein [Tanacetum cinerariifolium]
MLQMLNDAGEAKEEKQQQMDLRDVEVEVGWRSANKRTDWTEYIDHDEVHIHNDDDDQEPQKGVIFRIIVSYVAGDFKSPFVAFLIVISNTCSVRMEAAKMYLGS